MKRLPKPEDLTLAKDCGDTNYLAIYDKSGNKIALIFDEDKGKLLVQCYNLSAFLFR